MAHTYLIPVCYGDLLIPTGLQGGGKNRKRGGEGKHGKKIMKASVRSPKTRRKKHCCKPKQGEKCGKRRREKKVARQGKLRGPLSWGGMLSALHCERDKRKKGRGEKKRKRGKKGSSSAPILFLSLPGKADQFLPSGVRERGRRKVLLARTFCYRSNSSRRIREGVRRRKKRKVRISTRSCVN